MTSPEPLDDAFLSPEDGNAIELRHALTELRLNAWGKVARRRDPNATIQGQSPEDLASDAMIEYLKLRDLGYPHLDALRMTKHPFLTNHIKNAIRKDGNNKTTSMFRLDEDGELVEMDFPARDEARLYWPAWYVALMDEVLTLDERLVIDAVFVHDLTQAAIALRLGMSQPTVSRLRVSALAKIGHAIKARE